MKSNYFSLFNEKKESKNSLVLVSQNFIDRGAHPDKFEKSPFKDEMIKVYNNRIILEIEDIMKKNKPKNLETYSTKKLDKLYLQICKSK